MASPVQYYKSRRIAEGGLSRAKTDTVSKDPKNFAPCSFTYKGITASDWHTNMGIIWPTFKALAPKVGIPATCERFFNMSSSDWEKIFNEIWRSAGGFDNKSTAIANIIFQMRWGSGPGSLKNQLSPWFKEFFAIEPKSWSAVAALANQAYDKGDEKKLFDFLWNKRNDFLTRLGDKQPANKNGWLKDWKKFYAFNQQFIDPANAPIIPQTIIFENPSEGTEADPEEEKQWYQKPVTWIIGGSALALTAGVIVYRRRKKRKALTYNFAA